MNDLHERIRKCLGWVGLADTRSIGLHGLRELVRPIDPVLADEITRTIDGAAEYIRRRGES